VVGGTDKGDLEHRPNEDGSLPKALTEERSKAIPHSQASEQALLHSESKDQHQTGQKPSLMDKLNPKYVAPSNTSLESHTDVRPGLMPTAMARLAS
jgi:hypothetical protein